MPLQTLRERVLHPGEVCNGKRSPRECAGVTDRGWISPWLPGTQRSPCSCSPRILQPWRAPGCSPLLPQPLHRSAPCRGLCRQPPWPAGKSAALMRCTSLSLIRRAGRLAEPGTGSCSLGPTSPRWQRSRVSQETRAPDVRQPRRSPRAPQRFGRGRAVWVPQQSRAVWVPQQSRAVWVPLAEPSRAEWVPHRAEQSTVGSPSKAVFPHTGNAQLRGC